MIIKPKRRGGFKQFSDYLQGKAGNENDNEAVNLVSDSLGLNSINDFCILTSKIAVPKREGKYPLKNPIEHISIRTRAGDILTPEMIQSKIPELLERLGYQDCPWILVQHLKKQKNGAIEPHYHLGICRIDKNGNIPNPKSRDICEELANKFAREFGWKPAFAGANGDRYRQQKDHLARLWEATEKLSPAERLKKFEKAGFTAAHHDKRDELVFLDRYGKPYSLHRIPGIKKQHLKQADITAAFGFTKETISKLPLASRVAKTIRRKNYVRKITRRFTRGVVHALGAVAKVCAGEVPKLRGGSGVAGLWAAYAFLHDTARVPGGVQRGELQPLRTGKLAPKPRIVPRRLKATTGWWVAARMAGVFEAMIAAGFSEAAANLAVDRVVQEEEGRQAAEQRYLDWLQGYSPTRGGVGKAPDNKNGPKAF